MPVQLFLTNSNRFFWVLRPYRLWYSDLTSQWKFSCNLQRGVFIIIFRSNLFQCFYLPRHTDCHFIPAHTSSKSMQERFTICCRLMIVLVWSWLCVFLLRPSAWVHWMSCLPCRFHSFLALSSVLYHSFVKYFPNLASFCLLPSFSQFNDKYCTINIDGVLGIRTRDRRMAQTNPLSYGGALYSQTLHQKSWLYFCLAMQLCLINLVLWSHSFLLAILLLRYNLVFLFAKSGRYCYIF